MIRNVTSKEETLERYRAFARTGAAGPTAQRAALDGYDVRSAVMKAIEARFPPDEGEEHLDYKWSERSSPSAKALDRREELLKQVSSLALPDWITVDVSRVQRITGTSAKSVSKKTGIVVTISAPEVDDKHLLYFVE